MPFKRDAFKVKPSRMSGDLSVDEVAGEESVEVREQERQVREPRVLDEIRVRLVVGAAVGGGEADLEG